MEHSPIRSEINALIRDIDIGENNLFSANLAIPENFTGFSGHFPGEPILPGICQIQCIIAILAKVHNKDLTLASVVKAKFLNPILPNEDIFISGSSAIVNGKIEAKFKLIKQAGTKQVNVSRFHIQCNLLIN